MSGELYGDGPMAGRNSCSESPYADLWETATGPDLSAPAPVLHPRCWHCLQYVEPGEDSIWPYPPAGHPDPQSWECIPRHVFCAGIAICHPGAREYGPDFLPGLYFWLERHLDGKDLEEVYLEAFRLNESTFENGWDDDACVIAEIMMRDKRWLEPGG